MGDIYFVDDGEMRAFLTQKVYMGREACEPPTRKRVLSPFQGDTGRDGRLAGRRACAPYSLCCFKINLQKLISIGC